LSISNEKVSVLALQVTFFPKNGFCIGFTIHHGVFDGKSFTLFMKSWAYTCSKLHESPSLISSSLPENLTPLFDRSVIRDPKRIGKIYADKWLKNGGPNNRSLKVWDSIHCIQTDAIKGLFEFTPLHIQKLKKYAESKMKTKVQLSTFSVTCAYVLTCLVKVE
jgi:isoflavone 7-O-glucoside-6''-O-malonyltransferase